MLTVVSEHILSLSNPAHVISHLVLGILASLPDTSLAPPLQTQDEAVDYWKSIAGGSNTHEEAMTKWKQVISDPDAML